jgi:hypothetical protein
MAFITVAGEQLIAQKQGANEVLSITHFVLAYIDGLGPEPEDRIEAMPDAGDIVDTRPVTWQGYVNANQVVYSLTLDSSIGDYQFNWVGLKAAGGQLVAATHIETQTKSKTAGALHGNNLTRNFLLAYNGIQATTAIEVPAETWQIDFTDRVWEIDERQRLSNFDNYGPGAFFCDGFKVSHASGNTYTVAAGVGYVGGIRCANAEALTLSVAAPPKAVWIDASLQGDINGVVAKWAVTATSAELADYTDALGFDHFVAKIAEIPSAGVVNDLRPAAPVFLRRDDIVPEAEARAGTAQIPRAWTAERVKQAVGNQVPDASETVKGKVELATAAETVAGTDNTRAVHPAGLMAALNATSGLLQDFLRMEKTSYQDVVSATWADVSGLSAIIAVDNAPVTIDLFARISAHFNAAPRPAFCRVVINGGPYANEVIDKAMEEGLSTYTIGQSFVMRRRLTIAANGTYTIKVQIRNSAAAPTQNVRINASDETPTGPTTDALSVMEIGIYS